MRQSERIRGAPLRSLLSQTDIVKALEPRSGHSETFEVSVESAFSGLYHICGSCRVARAPRPLSVTKPLEARKEFNLNYSLTSGATQ